MKKIFTLTLALILALSLVACGASNSGGLGDFYVGGSSAPGETGDGNTTKPTDPPATQTDPIVGMWRADYNTYKSVFFFNEDGTFIILALISSYNAYGSPYSTIELFKGNYKRTNEKIEYTNLFRYTNDPNNGGKGGTEGADIAADSVLRIQQILMTGSRNEVLGLLDLNHDLYNLKGRDWDDWDEVDGEFVWIDSDSIEIPMDLFGGNNKFTRVK